VFAAALVGNKRVPQRLRQLLNVESGINDGLALPFVLVLLAVAQDAEDLHLVELGTEIAVGLAIGVVVPWVAIRLERTRVFSAAVEYQAINAVAIGLLVFALGKATHGNLFLAAFRGRHHGRNHRQAGEGSVPRVRRAGRRTAQAGGALVFEALISPALWVRSRGPGGCSRCSP
jgi:sodium/hydrogen antiporter